MPRLPDVLPMVVSFLPCNLPFTLTSAYRVNCGRLLIPKLPPIRLSVNLAEAEDQYRFLISSLFSSFVSLIKKACLAQSRSKMKLCGSAEVVSCKLKSCLKPSFSTNRGLISDVPTAMKVLLC